MLLLPRNDWVGIIYAGLGFALSYAGLDQGNRLDWLKQFLTLPNGIPSRDCIRRLLMALRPEAFQQCFQIWIAQAVRTDDSGPTPLIAIDGKTCRRSHDAAHGLVDAAMPVYNKVLAPWLEPLGSTLGMVFTVMQIGVYALIKRAADKSGFMEEVRARVAAKVESIPEDARQDPDLRIAGPLAQHYPFVALNAGDAPLRDLRWHYPTHGAQ